MPAQPVSRVRFPVLRRFAITGYALYEDKNGEGLSAEMYPGVNIVVGVNGLGKTTLLNAVFRVLTGPTDWTKRTIGQPAGNTPTTLGPWRDDTFFRDRVPDHARNAQITATIGFGTDEIQITRRLGDLTIVRLLVNGKSRAPDHETYETEVIRLAGVDSFEDFFLVLRYTVFYLESRLEVLWDPAAQADILRVLFYDREVSQAIVSDARRVQQLDSEYRNRLVQHNRLKEDLSKKEKALTRQDEVGRELQEIQVRIEAAQDRVREATATSTESEREYRRNRLLLEREKVKLVELRREQEFQEQSYYATLFPDLRETVQYLVVHLASGGGCLVCGSQSLEAMEHVRNALDAHKCPVCASPPADQERVVPTRTFSSKRLREIQQEAAVLLTHIGALETKVAAERARLISSRSSLTIARDERAQAEREYEELAGTTIPSDAEVSALRQVVARETEYLADLDARRKVHAVKLRAALVEGEKQTRHLSVAIGRYFEAYANLFFAHGCALEYDFVQRAIGQRQGGAGTFTFPRFVPQLVSGGFDTVAQPRYDANDVSESQREFADICFRMALMSVAAENRPAMLVLETPEASLDSAYIARAGRLFSEFAASRSSSNYLIASSNLNQTHMIPALFGIFQGEEQRLVDGGSRPVPAEERESRVIDLLDYAKHNVGVQRDKTVYRASFLAALYPDTGGVPPKKKRTP